MGQMNPSNLLKSKMKKIETKFYVRWIIEETNKDRASFNEFSKGEGIIATREKFLKTKQGIEELASRGCEKQ